MKLLMKLRHWQIFLLIFIPGYFINDRLTMLIIVTGILTFYSAWIFTIVVLGQLKLNEEREKVMKANLFKISCFLAPILWLKLMVAPPVLTSFISEPIMRTLNMILAVVFIMAELYMIYFAARIVKTIEIKNEPKIKEILFLMVGFIILPVGIWYIQPKINKIYA
ncbi:MAG: hypothetical protein AB9834_02755 [Lentimicrobium sp.]